MQFSLEYRRIHTVYEEKTEMKMNQTFTEEEKQVINKYMKKCSTSLGIREMQIKTTLRFHLTPIRIANIKNTSNNKC